MFRQRCSPVAGLDPLIIGPPGNLLLFGGLPAGTPVLDVFLQVVVGDPAVPGGIAATNGLQMHIQ